MRYFVRNMKYTSESEADAIVEDIVREVAYSWLISMQLSMWR